MQQQQQIDPASLGYRKRRTIELFHSGMKQPAMIARELRCGPAYVAWVLDELGLRIIKRRAPFIFNKINFAIAEEIRRLISVENIPRKVIKERFGISLVMISKIMTGKAWHMPAKWEKDNHDATQQSGNDGGGNDAGNSDGEVEGGSSREEGRREYSEKGRAGTATGETAVAIGEGISGGLSEQDQRRGI